MKILSESAQFAFSQPGFPFDFAVLRGTEFAKLRKNARPRQGSLMVASTRLSREAGAVAVAANKLKKFFKIVVDFMKYGCYYTEVASREAQQKSLRN